VEIIERIRTAVNNFGLIFVGLLARTPIFRLLFFLTRQCMALSKRFPLLATVENVTGRAILRLSLSGVHYNCFVVPESLYVAHRRLAEQSTVLAIELADTFVAHLEGCARSI
jgi:ABC-type antimicrobial peptide transport system permease subunit